MGAYECNLETYLSLVAVIAGGGRFLSCLQFAKVEFGCFMAVADALFCLFSCTLFLTRDSRAWGGARLVFFFHLYLNTREPTNRNGYRSS